MDMVQQLTLSLQLIKKRLGFACRYRNTITPLELLTFNDQTLRYIFSNMCVYIILKANGFI